MMPRSCTSPEGLSDVPLPAADTTAPVTYAFGEGIPAPGRSLEVAPGVHWLRMPRPFALDPIHRWRLKDGGSWTLVDCGLDDVAPSGRWQPLFHQASERSDRGGYFALGECIAHLNHLLHAGRVRRHSDVGGVPRFIATSTPEHS